MAAGANPSPGVHNNVINGANAGNSNGGGPKKANGRGVSATENTAVEPAQLRLRHNPGISVIWTPEEQSILEELLVKHASDTTLLRYAKIAHGLREKTVREVVLRCRWMHKKENGKRRKDENISSRKTKNKKILEKTTEPLPTPQVAYHSNGPPAPPYAHPTMSMDYDDGISFNSIGGAIGKLLENNAHTLDQISANFANLKMQDNIHLFAHARDNIISILNEMSSAQELMKHMPPLPVMLNEDLSSILSPPSYNEYPTSFPQDSTCSYDS